MPGVKGKSGRKKKSGLYFRLYGVRFDPLRHPPEFETFLATLNEATPAERAALLLDIFLNGRRAEEPDQPVGEETSDDTSALEDMFNEF